MPQSTHDLGAHAGCRGTPGYSAPEVHTVGAPVSSSADIYMLGMTCLEMDQQEAPFHGQDWTLLNQLQKDGRLPLPAVHAGCTRHWRHLILKCTQRDLSRRPSASRLCTLIERMAPHLDFDTLRRSS